MSVHVRLWFSPFIKIPSVLSNRLWQVYHLGGRKDCADAFWRGRDAILQLKSVCNQWTDQLLRFLDVQLVFKSKLHHQAFSSCFCFVSQSIKLIFHRRDEAISERVIQQTFFVRNIWILPASPDQEGFELKPINHPVLIHVHTSQR